MKKIILSAFISTALVGSTFAEAPSPAFNGFYLGGGLTYTNGKINQKVTNIPGNNMRGASSRGVGFNVFTGYGAVFGGGFYLGGELGLGYDGSRFRNANAGTIGAAPATQVQFVSKSKATYSIAARLGYAIANVLPYVKVGIEGRSPAKLKTASGTQVTFASKDVSVGRSGIILGAGIDYAVTKNVFIRGEYMHNFGSRSTYSVNNIKVAEFRTPTDTFLIGAAYKF